MTRIQLAGLSFLAADANGIPVSQLDDRSRPATAARQQVCAVLRASGWSLPAIAEQVGRDHRTVIYSVRQARWEPWMDDVTVAPVNGTRIAGACEVPSCDRRGNRRGLCGGHRWRLDRYGDVFADIGFGEGGLPVQTREPPPADRCADCDGEVDTGGPKCIVCMLAGLDRAVRERARRSGPSRSRGRTVVRQARGVPA